MKVQVINKQGIDEAGNKHPAPGIADGTHECELKWQHRKILGIGTAIASYTDWKNCNEDDRDYLSEFAGGFRQIWVLAQEKEPEVIPDIELGEEIRFSYLAGNVIIYHDGEEIYSMDSTKIKSLINYLNSTQQSTRIAELQSRVAELEGVLKEIQVATDEYRNYSHLLKSIQVVNTLATNALKNQQP